MRLAIFGGTFDPIHSAHLTVAKEAADQFQLDRVLFIPAAHPPHKHETVTSYEHRYRMVELACEVDPRFAPSRLEAGQEKSYSYYTIQRLKQDLEPEDRVFFLIGADAFAEIGTWHRSQEVIQLVDFIVVTRPGHKYEPPAGARIHRLETLALPASSSEIRQKLAEGQPVRELPENVLRHIQKHRLYR